MSQQASDRNVALIVMLMLASISCVVTAVLMISGRYIQLSYQANSHGNPYAGMEIWGLNQVAVMFSLILFVCAAVSAVWPSAFAKNVTWPKLLTILISLLFLSVTFFPSPFEFQVRQYHSASQQTYILLAQDSADFIEGNEALFTGSLKREKIEDFYPVNTSNAREFNCVTETSWWWGKLAVIHNFYPILDKQNHLQLLERNCKEITHG